MARGKKTGGRNFEKGHLVRSPPMGSEVRKIRKFEIKEFYKVVNECLDLSMVEFKEMLTQMKAGSLNNINMRKAIILRVMSQCMAGNVKATTELFNRLLGKPHQTMEIKSEEDEGEKGEKLFKIIHVVESPSIAKKKVKKIK